MRERRGDVPPPRVSVDREGIEGALGALASREREVLRLRFGIGGRKHGVEEVGRYLGLSAAQVRRIEWRALSALRANALRDALG